MALSLYDLNNNKATRDVATTISDGLMSATDKQKLDGIQGADLVKKDGSVPMDNLTIGSRKTGADVGSNSFVQGNNCEASGNYSHAEGGTTTASGSRSHAEGGNTTASGNYSHAQNRYTIAQGYSQTAIGRYNVLQGTGTGVSATDDAFIIGNGTSTSLRSNAFKVTFDGKTWTQEGYYVGASNNKVLHEGNISSSALNLAQASGVKGTGTGNSNKSYFRFMESDGTTSQGCVGKVNTTNNIIYLLNEIPNGSVELGVNGTGKATVNGNEIYHVGNLKAKTDATLYNEILGTAAGTLITSGTHNQAIGHGSLSKNVGGSGNTAIGSYALFNNTGNNNFAIGQNALYENTTGTNNIGIGQGAVQANTTGNSNIGIGTASLWGLASGQNNIGLGTNAGRYYGTGTNILTTANQCVYIGNVSRASANDNTNEIVIGYGATGKGSNTAVIGNSSITNLYVGDATVQFKPTDTNSFYGNNAGRLNAGTNNTGIGEQTLWSANLTGSGNTAVGKSALNSNSIASYNTGIGMKALDFTSSGSNNVAVGTWALQNNTTGTYNVGIGVGAGRYYGASTNVNTKANNCIYIGYDTRSNADNATNEIVIGYNAKGYGSNTAHIGNSSVTSISFGAGTGTAFTNRSDRRLKEDIIDADTSICYDTIKNLPLHRFKYKDFVGNEGDQHLTGFIADEFEQVFPKAVFKNDHSFPLLDEFGNPIMKAVSEEVIEIDEFGNEIKKTIEREVEDSFIIEDCASIDTSQIVPTLLGAVQKMMQEIEELKTEVVILKGIQ